jgi:TPR repeat protein
MLLETARELIARDGEAALTLSAVADEAGLAHATVYGYFSGKRDILTALGPVQVAPGPNAPAVEQANELAPHDLMEHQPSLAALIHHPVLQEGEGSDRAGQERVVDPALESKPSIGATAAEQSAPTSGPLVTVEPSESREAATGMAPPGTGRHFTEVEAFAGGLTRQAEAASQTPAETPRSEQAYPEDLLPVVAPAEAESEPQLLVPLESERDQAAHLDEIVKRLILPENALKQGTDAVIARLEIRLKVLERAIAGVEARQHTITNESDRKIKPVSELVSRLQTRADDAEDRLRQALAELRLHIHELKARQDRLEQNGSDGGTQVADGEVPAHPKSLMAFPPEETEKPEVEEPQGVSQDEAPDANPRQSYLSAVRNSAKEGARQAAERESLQEEEKDARRRRFLTAAGIAVVCLAVAGLLYRFHPGAHGVSTAQSKAFEPGEVPHKLHALVPRTPLDRLTELASKGDARAELVVGLKYLKGDGIAANDAEAARWLARAAQVGDPIAENHLGELYQTGRGVKPDIAQAMHWYEAAAAQGDRHAMSNLAVLYAGGAGAPANFAEAARWFQRSASLGYVDAQFNLAVLFERGDGVPQSLLDAYKWYSIAAAAGDAVAKTRANAIATQVSQEELQVAQQAITHFKPEPANQAANDVPTMAQVLAAR